MSNADGVPEVLTGFVDAINEGDEEAAPRLHSGDEAFTA
jgi:hypothetical protein